MYSPSEDTFQLLEAIKVKPDDLVLEIGTGCGIVALECARLGAKVICTDINPYAVKLTSENYSKNMSLLKGTVEIRLGDLFSIIKPEEKFDIVIFNPPYLPTNAEERIGGSGWFDIATDGGIDGLKVTKRFIGQVGNYLKSNGCAYFVFSSLSDKKKLEKYISNAGFKSEIVLSRWYNDERIEIIRIENS